MHFIYRGQHFDRSHFEQSFTYNKLFRCLQSLLRFLTTESSIEAVQIVMLSVHYFRKFGLQQNSNRIEPLIFRTFGTNILKISFQSYQPLFPSYFTSKISPNFTIIDKNLPKIFNHPMKWFILAYFKISERFWYFFQNRINWKIRMGGILHIRSDVGSLCGHWNFLLHKGLK